MAKSDSKPQAAPVAAAAEASSREPEPPKAKPKRFKVGGLGVLHVDGVTFKAGEELPLSEDQIRAYGIEVAVPIED